MEHPQLSRIPLSSHGLGETRDWFAIEYEPTTNEVFMLDQRRLPTEVRYHCYSDVEGIATAIRKMVIRGAPAIGIAAAYGLALSARREKGDENRFLVAHQSAAKVLEQTRPTAVNLAWAIARMYRKAKEVATFEPELRHESMRTEAEAIHLEDLSACRQMGVLGAEDIPDGSTVLTHCNAGALATGGYGTALGVIRAAHSAGKKIKVLADETRPYLQGARLTAWELHRDGIHVEVITDNMAAHFFQKEEIHFVVVGSDRIAANGDIANKIGTYNVALLADIHNVPFTVAAPWSTVDLETATGAEIPIEERSPKEVAQLGEHRLVGEGIICRHPAFDITPARLIHAIYTERGVFSPRRGQTPQTLLK